MKVLFVCSGSPEDDVDSLKNGSPFVSELKDSLEKKENEIDVFIIRNKGVLGYLKEVPAFRRKVKNGGYDIVHAHYGISGMFAVFQRFTPVVISFIGEMNLTLPRLISRVAIYFSSYNIFVSDELRLKSKIKKNYEVIPYGVDLDIFFPVDQDEAREKMKIPKEAKVCLFASSKKVPIKNYKLAKQAVDLCEDITIFELMKGYTRDEVNLLINASDFVFLTSICEGSPQIIKEAMACNCPIISTDVGDVRDVIGKTAGCYVTGFEPNEIADKITKVLSFGKQTDGRTVIQHLDLGRIAQRVIKIYKKVTN